MASPFTPSRSGPQKADPPLMDLHVFVKKPLGEPEIWNVELRYEGQTPEQLAADIDKAFAMLREKTRELLK